MNINKSIQEFAKAKKYMPGGVNSPVRAFTEIGIPPIFMQKGIGSKIIDIDENEYIDYCMSWGSLILGHANKNIIKNTIKTIENGTSFGTCNLLETKLAKLIVKAVPSLEQIRFVNSGTEAVMSAIRLARAYTNKNLIIKFDGCYHGHSDSLLVKSGSGVASIFNASSSGIPNVFTQQTISVPFNDKEAVANVFREYKNKIAAIIVEPIPCNMGIIPPKADFLQFLRDITLTNNSLLIFDEVITGFRVSLGGAQEYFKIKPCITCFGKIIGGGVPIGAYGAGREIMSLVAPLGGMYQAGTLSGNPVAMTAGIQTLSILFKKDFYVKLAGKSNYFKSQMTNILKDKKNIKFHCLGSMFTLFFLKENSSINNFQDVRKCDIKKYAFFYKKLLQNHIYFSPSQYETNFISTAHTLEDLDKTLFVVQKID